MNYWLMKNEPSCYSMDDLEHDGTYVWDGVRNYQARNFMREMKIGDYVLYYYSNADPSGVAGIAKIVKEAYPDPAQFDNRSEYFDPKATSAVPRWDAVDISFVLKFREIVSLQVLKNDPFFSDMAVVKKGMRLSITPVSPKHFKRIMKLAGSPNLSIF